MVKKATECVANCAEKAKKSALGKKSSAKGSAYERKVAKRLSLWFSNGERDDLFYRTVGSGGRATQRFTAGKMTANSAGDLSSTDEVGAPFLQCVSVEIKKGYKQATLSQLFSARKPELLAFFAQSGTSAMQANVPNWLVIHKPDFQPEMVYMNMGLFNQVFDINPKKTPTTVEAFPVPVIFIFMGNMRPVACFKFDDFLTLDPKKFVPKATSRKRK